MPEAQEGGRAWRHDDASPCGQEHGHQPRLWGSQGGWGSEVKSLPWSFFWQKKYIVIIISASEVCLWSTSRELWGKSQSTIFLLAEMSTKPSALFRLFKYNRKEEYLLTTSKKNIAPPCSISWCSAGFPVHWWAWWGLPCWLEAWSVTNLFYIATMIICHSVFFVLFFWRDLLMREIEEIFPLKASRIILVFQARRLWRQILRAARTTSSLPTKVTHLELLTNCWINFLIDNHVFHIAGSTMWFQETSSINQQTFPLVLTLATKIVFSPVRKYIVPVDQISQKEPPIYH